MKTKFIATLIATSFLSGIGSLSLHAQEIKFNELPSAVQKTINAEAGPAGIASIQRLQRRGAPVYEVRLSPSDAASPKAFFVSETGALVNLNNVISSGATSTSGRLDTSSRKGTFGELPTPVQNAVRGQAGIARVEDIDILTRNGQTNYNVAFKREGKPVELWLDSTGNLLTNGLSAAQAAAVSQPRAPLSAASKVTLAAVPTAVQTALKNYARGAEIEDIDKGTLQGRTVYEAAFKHQGKNVELRVGEDGAVVRDDVNDSYLAEIGQAPPGVVAAQPAASAASSDWRSAATVPRVPLSAASKVSFRELPAAVRNAIRTYAETAAIEDIDRGTVNGQTVYEAAFKHGAQPVELRVAEDGSLVKDQVNERFITQFGRQTPSGTGVGRAPSWQILKGTGASGATTLSNPKPFAFGQLPLAVQTALRSQAGVGAIENIQQGTLNGKTVYQATVQPTGRTATVRVAEDGSILP